MNELWINNLRFADDVVLIGKNLDELGSMVEDLCSLGSKSGPTINLAKTKVMSKKDYLQHVQINNNNIETVKKYTYLGQILSFDNKIEKEIKVRTTKGW